MTKFLLWLISVMLLILSLGVSPTSILGSLLILLAGLYVSPLVRAKLPISLSQNRLMGGKGSTLVVFALLTLSISTIAIDISSAEDARRAMEYKSNPSLLADKVRGHIAAKEFFDAAYALDPLISSLPDEKSLQQLRHEVFLARLESYSSKGELHLFSGVQQYKKVMGKSPLIKEGEQAYAEQAVILTRRFLGEGKTYEANRIFDSLKENFPENERTRELTEDIQLAKERLEKEEAAQRERRAALAKQVSECKANWTRCVDNEQLMENYSGLGDAQVRCTVEANELARFGEPDWTRPTFTTYFVGDDYIRTGTLRLQDGKVKFQNGFGAYARVTLECHYDLDAKKVIVVLNR